MPHPKRSFVTILLIACIFLLFYHALQASPALSDSSCQVCDQVDWSRFAYAQYATTPSHLCNSVMLFERLHSLQSKADRLLMYPAQSSPNGRGIYGTLLRKARDQYGAKLKPIDVQRRRGDDPTWAESYTKLLAFNQTEYDRLLHLDSDSTVLQHMDELFLLPPSPAAMCRSYWETQPKLSGQMLLLEPSKHEFARIEKAIEGAGPTVYDMEILNSLYRDSAIYLPHKIYDLYTREFTPQRDTGANHEKYLVDTSLTWDPDVAFKTAKFVHFSDWPLPKPWIKPDPVLFDKTKPPCEKNGTTDETDCRNRDIWVGLHEDFRKRRKEICELDLDPM